MFTAFSLSPIALENPVQVPNQAPASDFPFYDAPQKVFLSKISDDVIASDLWFRFPPYQKSLLSLSSN